MKEKERRDTNRSPIRVLVRCLPPGHAASKTKLVHHGWEMWARDIADDGVGLRWSKRWAAQRCPSCTSKTSTIEKRKQSLCECMSPSDILKTGQTVELDGLVYGDKGSEPMQGLIQWIRADEKGLTCDVGIHVTTPDHRDFFRTLEAVL